MKLHNKDKYTKAKMAIKNRSYKNVGKYYVGVKKTNLYTVAYLVDPTLNIVTSVTSKGLKGNKTEAAFQAGEKLGKIILDKKINDLYFNRSGYLYYGRIKAVCDGIRKSGVKI